MEWNAKELFAILVFSVDIEGSLAVFAFGSVRVVCIAQVATFFVRVVRKCKTQDRLPGLPNPTIRHDDDLDETPWYTRTTRKWYNGIDSVDSFQKSNNPNVN